MGTPCEVDRRSIRGGPGSGTSPPHASLFDLERVRVLDLGRPPWFAEHEAAGASIPSMTQPRPWLPWLPPTHPPTNP